MGQAKKRVKRVALCGFAPMTRNQVPIQKDLEIWTLNEARMMKYHRIDRLFQMHPRFDWDPDVRDQEYLSWLNAQDCPIYMWETHHDIPNSVRYPIEELIAKFGQPLGPEHQGNAPYFTSTFAYMLALAIHEGYDEIHMYGIDLTSEEEYRYQRAGAEYLLGWAKALGIRVVIPQDCPLLKGPLYGQYNDAKSVYTQNMIDQRLGLLGNQRAQLQAQMLALDGAIQESTNWKMVLLRDTHSNAGLEHHASTFAGAPAQTVQAGQVVQSDGTGMAAEHVGLLEPVKV